LHLILFVEIEIEVVEIEVGLKEQGREG